MAGKRGRKPMFPWIADMVEGEERKVTLREYQNLCQCRRVMTVENLAFDLVFDAFMTDIKATSFIPRGADYVILTQKGYLA